MSSSHRSIAGIANSTAVIDQSGRILTAKYLGKASSKKDLVLRLRTILRCLREDENVEPDDPVRYPGLGALCHSLTRFVNHRDKEVRLYTVAACMELFAIYAPEAPWNEDETLDIFEQTIRQLANLGHSVSVGVGVGGGVGVGTSTSSATTGATTTSNTNVGATIGTNRAHFYQYYRILELLAEVKIAVLLVDLSKKNGDDDDDDKDNDRDNDKDGDDSSSSSSDDGSSNSGEDDGSVSRKRPPTQNSSSSGSSGNQSLTTRTVATANTTTTKNINKEALQVLSELFRTLLQSVRNEHPPEVFDYCQKTLTSCVEEFFESTILPVPILDELLVCIGQGPKVLVLQQQQQQQPPPKSQTQTQHGHEKQHPGRSRSRTQSQARAQSQAPGVVYVQQNNPSYMVASAVVRASVDRLSTPIASLLNGLINSDPRSVGASTISNHACDDDHEHDHEHDESPSPFKPANSAKSRSRSKPKPGTSTTDIRIPESVLERAGNLGRPKRQQQDAHGSTTVYCVVIELHRVAPAILTTVFGTLASHAESPDAVRRLWVVQTLGRLFAGQQGGSGSGSGDQQSSSGNTTSNGSGSGSLRVAYQYGPCFRQWLKRSGDRRLEIRRVMLPHLLALARAGSAVLAEATANSNANATTNATTNTNANFVVSDHPHAELAREIEEALAQRLTQEPSAKFRTEVVQGLCTLSYNHRRVLSGRLLGQLGERVLSRDRAERKDALTGLVQLHFRHYTRHHLATVLEGGDDCPIESVLEALDNCCPGGPATALPGVGSGSASVFASAFASASTKSRIAAKSANTSRARAALSPRPGGKKRGRSRHKRGTSSDPDGGDSDREENYGGNRNSNRNDRVNDDDGDFSYYQWIPCVLFESASYSDATDADMHSRVVQLVDELLLGCSSPHPDNKRQLTSTGRATGMAIVVDAIRRQSPLAWYWMEKLQSVRAKLQKTLRAYLEARVGIRKHSVGSEEYFAADAKAKDLLEMVASMIPQPSGASPAPGERHPVLEKFHSIKDKHIFRILGTITNPGHSAKSRARALDDLPRRVKATAGDAVSAWVKSLAKRCAMGDFINLDVIHHCVLLAQECFHEGELDATHKFLVCVQLAVESFPSLCASGEVFDNLSELFRECNGTTTSRNKDLEGPAIITALSAILASVAPYRNSDDDSSALEEDLHKKLVALCQNGTPEQARHSVATIVSLLKPKNKSEASSTQDEADVFLPLLQTLAAPSRMAIASTGSSTKLVCVMAALAELAENAPTIFESSARGMKALKFALERVLMGRAHVPTGSNDEDDEDDGSDPSDDDDHEAEVTKTPKRGRKRGKSGDNLSHLSPTATGKSLVEDENLSITCRTLCAAIELLSTFIRSRVFVAKKSRSILSETTQEIVGQVFDIFAQILRDEGMPPSSRDRESCSLRQDRAALRQCAAIHLFRLCDTRLGLDQKFLTTQRWHTLASSLLDDEPVVRKAVMEELGLMITGNGKYSTVMDMGAMAPRLRFVAMSVFCIDGSQGSHSRANGNAANIGKAIHNQKGNIAGCIAFLRKVYESNAVQCRAQGPQAEKQFEAFTKLTIMPEYAVPYAFHLLTCRLETPTGTSKGSGGGKSGKAKDDEDYEVDESGLRVLRKRLKALYDPLVLQLGASADNISFLLRMAEMLAKLFEPIDCTPHALGNGSTSRERAKLKNICATAREVLLSYVKTDANLDTHPGAIRMPGNLFRRREYRMKKAKKSSTTKDASPILDMMISTEDGVREKQNEVEKVIKEKSPRYTVNDNDTAGDSVSENNRKPSSRRRSTRLSRISDDGDSKMSRTNDETSSNPDKTHGHNEGRVTSRIPLRRSTRTRSTGSPVTNHEDSDSKMFSSPEPTSRNEDDSDDNNESQDTDRIALRKSRRSTRSTKFDDSGDSKTTDSGTFYENGSIGKRKRIIQSSQSSNDASSTVTISRNYMSSPQAEVDPSSTKLYKGSNKKRRSDASQGSLANSRVHFSPEVDFGGLSPINRRSSRNHARDDKLLSSSETKTRGTTPPSHLRDAKFSATASLALGSTRSPDAKASESPTPVSESTTNHSVGGLSSQQSDGKAKPLGDKIKEAARPRRMHASKRHAVDDKENTSTTKKKKAIPKQIKIVRSNPSPKGKVSKVVKKKTRTSVGKRSKGRKSKPIDSFDFEG